MSIYNGDNNSSKIYLGSTEVQKIYLGSSQVWTTPSGGGEASVTISVFRSTLKVAPEGIDFEVTGWSGFDTPGPESGKTFDPRLHDLVYIWDFGDSGATYSAPVNVPPEFKNANVGYGWRVSHTYRNPGSPTISVLVIEPSSGKFATASVTLNGTGSLSPIEDEDVAFTGANTIWVDTAGNTSGMPAGATVVTSVVAAETLIKSRSNPTRVILRSGQTFVRPNNDLGGDTWPTAYWRASDLSGTRPVIDWSGGSGVMWDFRRGDTSDGVKMVKLNHIDVRGPNDLVAGSRVGETMIKIGSTAQRYLQAHDCVFGQVDLVYYPIGDRATIYAARAVFNDCHFKDNDFALYGYFEDLSVTGCRFTQNPNNNCGGLKGCQLNEHGGSMRIPRGDRGVIDGCDMMVRGGWGAGDPVLQNSALRWNNLSLPSRLNLRRTTFEAGYSCISLANMNAGAVTRAVNYTMGECIIVGSWSTDSFIAADCGGVTVENCLGIVPVVQGDGKTRKLAAFVNMSSTSASSTGRDERISVRNNTMVIEASNAKFSSAFSTPPFFGGSTAPFTAAVMENNVYHAPNLSTPVLANPALVKKAPFGSATHPGYRVVWVRSQSYSDPVPPGGSFTLPYPPGTTAPDFGTFPWTILLNSGATGAQTEGAGFSVVRGATDFTIINDEATTWTGTRTVYLDRRNGGTPMPLDTNYATTSNAMSLWRPASAPGSTPNGYIQLIDLTGRIRPGTVHPNAGTGTPSIGALEP